jgi:hypothetical protein
MFLEIDINATAENSDRLLQFFKQWLFWCDGETWGSDGNGVIKRQQIGKFASNFHFRLNTDNSESKALADFVFRAKLRRDNRTACMPEEQIMSMYHAIKKAEKGEQWAASILT